MNRQRHTNSTGIRPRPAGPSAGSPDKIGGRLLIVTALCLGLIIASSASSETTPAKYKEYEVKAAFIYNFLKFVDWPQGKNANDNNQITIGIVGEDPFGSAADVFKGKTIEERKLVVQRFDGIEQIRKLAEKDKNEQLEAIKRCHLLFICPSEQKLVREITDIVAEHSVLTVGDVDGFIEAGGIVNFFTEDNKIRFDINQTVAEKAGLKIRSQLLRLAKRVIKEESQAKDKNSSRQEGN